MSKLQLSETVPSVAKATGNRWKAVLAVPGKGSSGVYTREILKEYGPSAIPAGTKAWIGHASPEKRDPRDRLGKYPDGAYYDDNLEPKSKYPHGGLVAELQVDSRYAAVVEDLGSDAELSLYVDGDVDDEGNVVAMYPSRTNSCDLVSYAGLTNSGLLEKMYESIHDSDESLPETSAVDQKKEKEAMATIEERLDALTKAVELLSAAKATEAKADADAEVQAKAEEIAAAKVDDVLGKYDEAVKQIDAAELVPSMAESLRLEARKGVDVTPLVETAKKTMAEMKTKLSESTGGYARVNDSDGSKNDDFMVSRWNS